MKQKDNPWRSLLERKEDDDGEHQKRGRKRESLPRSLSTEADQRFVLCITMDIRSPILMSRPCDAAFTDSYLMSKQAVTAWKSADVFSRFIGRHHHHLCRMWNATPKIIQHKSNTSGSKDKDEWMETAAAAACAVMSQTSDSPSLLRAPKSARYDATFSFAVGFEVPVRENVCPLCCCGQHRPVATRLLGARGTSARNTRQNQHKLWPSVSIPCLSSPQQ